jgi:hypothetical protein
MIQEQPRHYDKELAKATTRSEKQKITKDRKKELSEARLKEEVKRLNQQVNVRRLHESVKDDGIPEIHLIDDGKQRTKRVLAIERAKLYAICQVLKYNKKAYMEHLHRGLKNAAGDIFED